MNCEQNCKGSGTGSIDYDPVQGCICDVGWTGRNCGVDIDECQEDPNMCSDVRKTCINKDGFYYCDCIDGYKQEDADETCVGINNLLYLNCRIDKFEKKKRQLIRLMFGCFNKIVKSCGNNLHMILDNSHLTSKANVNLSSSR